jgi:DtxR family Mn-dependent transcriptional regulator
VDGHHPAVEQYLETILELEESGVVPLRARLVERLGVSAPAVSETVKRLEREGYLTLDDERVMHLTATGRAYATSVLRRHRLAELLLVDVLKVPWSQVHEEACRLEHAISDNLEAHLVKLLGDPGACPHGNPIPGSGYEAPDAVALADLAVGGGFTVSRIPEELEFTPGLLEFLEDSQITPGRTGRVEAASPDGTVTVRIGDRTIGVGAFASKRILVASS